jgi:hypothetical protein
MMAALHWKLKSLRVLCFRELSSQKTARSVVFDISIPESIPRILFIPLFVFLCGLFYFSFLPSKSLQLLLFQRVSQVDWMGKESQESARSSVHLCSIDNGPLEVSN